MSEHKLKCLSPYFDALERGDKNFEVRRDDRGFQRGDVLVLEKYNDAGPDRGYVLKSFRPPTPYSLRRRITYILTGGQFGIEPGYVVLGLAEDV